jgi:multiple sugar transport system substrate-binding protein
MTRLRGTTWDHPRWFGGLDATARAFGESHEGTEVSWDRSAPRRVLEGTLEERAETYDLLVVDHTEVGAAAARGCLLPLEGVISAPVLELQHEQSAGPSYRSYEYGGHQWALAVDASAQFSAYREDLLASPPRDWDSVVDLALSQGQRVAVPLAPPEAFESFLTLCSNAGEPPFLQEGVVASRDTALHALTLLGRLAHLANGASLESDSPRVLEMMSTGDEIAYSPLISGYSGYSKKGFRPHAVRFCDIPSSGEGPTGSALGGAGIAVSSKCAEPRVAAEYALMVCQPEVQRGLYFQSGGQPGNRAAWLDEGVNLASDGFFRGTLATISGAYLRPRYDGFLAVQSACGDLIHDWLAGGGDPERLYAQLNARCAERKT